MAHVDLRRVQSEQTLYRMAKKCIVFERFEFTAENETIK